MNLNRKWLNYTTAENQELSWFVNMKLTPSALSSWIKKYNNTGSFHVEDNRSDEEKELIRLRKENQRLKMENDILKQAALIMGRK